jgi:hypothetical protein
VSHSVRHVPSGPVSYATAALKAGVHLKTISVRRRRHSETFTASVYQHAMPGMDREAAGAIAALFVDAVEPVASESVSTGHETAPQDLS